MEFFKKCKLEGRCIRLGAVVFALSLGFSYVITAMDTAPKRMTMVQGIQYDSNNPWTRVN